MASTFELNRITLETEAGAGANVEFHFVELGRKISKAHIQMQGSQFQLRRPCPPLKGLSFVFFSMISLGSNL